MKWKFKIGDRVEVILGGHGCHPDTEIGKKVKITKLGNYAGSPGYIVSPAIGNTKLLGTINGFIGEKSFKLINSWFKNGKPNWKKKYNG